jgi:hypothetical protein
MGTAGYMVWVKSWIGKIFPAVCMEVDEVIFVCTVPRPLCYSEENYFICDTRVQTEMHR